MTLAQLPESPTAAGAAPKEASPGPEAAAAAEEGGAGGRVKAEAEEEGEEAEAAPLAWLPATPAALALRLHSLDAALLYGKQATPARERLPVRRRIWLAGRPAEQQQPGAPLLGLRTTSLPCMPARPQPAV